MREEKDELKNQMKKLNEIDNEQAPPESDENSNPTNEEEEEIDSVHSNFKGKGHSLLNNTNKPSQRNMTDRERRLAFYGNTKCFVCLNNQSINPYKLRLFR